MAFSQSENRVQVVPSKRKRIRGILTLLNVTVPGLERFKSPDNCSRQPYPLLIF